MVKREEHQAAEDMMVRWLARELEASRARLVDYRPVVTDDIRQDVKKKHYTAPVPAPVIVAPDGEIIETPTQAMERAARELSEFRKKYKPDEIGSTPTTLTLEDIAQMYGVELETQEQVNRIIAIMQAGKPAGRKRK